MANDRCGGYNALRYKFVEDITEWQVFIDPKLFKFLENVTALRKETTESMVLAPNHMSFWYPWEWGTD